MVRRGCSSSIPPTGGLPVAHGGRLVDEASSACFRAIPSAAATRRARLDHRQCGDGAARAGRARHGGASQRSRNRATSARDDWHHDRLSATNTVQHLRSRERRRRRAWDGQGAKEVRRNQRTLGSSRHRRARERRLDLQRHARQRFRRGVHARDRTRGGAGSARNARCSSSSSPPRSPGCSARVLRRESHRARVEIVANLNMDGGPDLGRTRDLPCARRDQEFTLGPQLAAMLPSRRGSLSPEEHPEAGLVLSVRPLLLREGVACPPCRSVRGGRLVGRPKGWGVAAGRRGLHAHRYHQPSDTYRPDFDLTGAVQLATIVLTLRAPLANCAGAADVERRRGVQGGAREVAQARFVVAE